MFWSNVIVFPSTATSSAYNVTVIEVGLNLSWLLLSSHTFVTGISIVSGACVFVIINPVVLFPSIVGVYPVGVEVSLTVYSISTPFLYFCNPVNVPFHPFPSFNTSVFPLTGLPSAYNWTVTESGLIPSWLLLSTHTFSTGIFIVSGVCVFVTVNPSSIEPSTETSYPDGLLSSLTV